MGKLKAKVSSVANGESLPASPVGGTSEPRTWTFTDGSQLDAYLIAADADHAQLRVVKTMGVGEVDLEIFSPEDREDIMAWVVTQGRNGTAGYPLPLKKHQWPSQWRDTSEVSMHPVEGTQVWNSENFEIVNEAGIGPDALKSIVRICESVNGALSSLPLPLPLNWGRPTEERNRIIIEAENDGSVLENAAGYWDGRTGHVHIFADQLVEPDYQLVVFEFDKPERVQKYDTIVHEVTHQSTAALMYLGTPAWVSEGLAEYMAATQFAPANYHFTNTHVSFRYHINKLLVGDRIVKDRRMNVTYLRNLMNRDVAEWNQIATADASAGRLQYDQSLLLVDYFAHRDHPDGLHFRRYLECVLSGVPEPEARDRHLMRGRRYQELEQELIDLWKPLGLTLNFQDRGSIAASDITIDWAAEDNKRAIANERAMKSENP
ncbi:MAG: hypothetical protein AAGA96_14170 [Verrucomicrobiota bacterium]